MLRMKYLILLFLALSLISSPAVSSALEESTDKIQPVANFSRGDGIKAVYLSQSFLNSKAKIDYLLKIAETTEINAVVIDFKDNRLVSDQNLRNIIAEFKKRGCYVIGRLVAFQDSSYARAHPECAIKKHSGEFWYSGKKSWKRYWLDPAHPKVLEYTIYAAKTGIDMGFDEINFDYIRFPSDGNMKDIVYPYWDGKISKYQVMAKFFQSLRDELKIYNPNIKLSVDIFGEAFFCDANSKDGPREPGIGQKLSDLAKYFDIICPMAYPSHYQRGTFGLSDPNLFPYETYYRTLKPGIGYLDRIKSSAKVRPWIQDFSIRNIYGGQKVIYGPKEVRAQIQAGIDLKIDGFMLWNVNNRYTTGALLPEK